MNTNRIQTDMSSDRKERVGGSETDCLPISIFALFFLKNYQVFQSIIQPFLSVCRSHPYLSLSITYTPIPTIQSYSPSLKKIHVHTDIMESFFFSSLFCLQSHLHTHIISLTLSLPPLPQNIYIHTFVMHHIE